MVRQAKSTGLLRVSHVRADFRETYLQISLLCGPGKETKQKTHSRTTDLQAPNWTH